MEPGDAAQRAHEIVVFGATGYVGRLTVQHLAGSAPAGLRVALAGRSLQALEAVRAELGRAAADWPLVVADATDPEAMARLAASTRVLATTVGPYSRHGLALAQACARAGTDYADLSAGVLFVRETLALHDLARSTGARIVHACGFDSVPSDLGVLLLHQEVVRDGAGQLEDTTMLIDSARGGISGGTIESFRTQVDALRRDPSLQLVLRDAYSLSPDRAAEPDLGPQLDLHGPRRDPDLGVWTAPFPTGPYNARIVRRSNALLGFAYGRRFRYREAARAGHGPTAPLVAWLAATGQRAFATAMAVRGTRALLDRVLPRPGAGPSEAARSAGHFSIGIHATTSTGQRYLATVSGKRDPGYSSTAVMLAESALCLALDRAATPGRAGVLTPATALGMPLVERLRGAGFTFTIERVATGASVAPAVDAAR